MSEVDELSKIRKILEYIAKQLMRQIDGSEYDEAKLTELSK